MITRHSLPVSFSWLSTDLPILSALEASAILYQKDRQQFHLLINQLEVPRSIADCEPFPPVSKRLLWLEISPSRAILTVQGTDKFACRHFWEQGIYGTSRYWLNGDAHSANYNLRLQNFTRSVQLEGHPLPRRLRVDYELWSGTLPLGHYVLHLEIFHSN